MTHTLGPWFIDSDTVGNDLVGRIQILAENIGFVAAVGDLDIIPNNSLADAYLIAAAPQLFEALVHLDATIMPEERKYDEWGYCRIHHDILCEFDAVVKEAIAAAKPEVTP